MKPRWVYRPENEKAAGEIISALSLHPVIASILCKRDITTARDAYHFLNPRLSGLHSPFLMHGIDAAVARIRRAVEGGETIAIFSDSDLDGLTSLTTVVTLLNRLSPGLPVITRYPRNGEQYGLTQAVIGEFREKGATLLVTLDCGTRDIDEIAYAADAGLDTIVCDHHEPEERLPGAIIVNPRLRECGYPFKDLAGVGVAFKLCHAVLLSYLPGHSRRYLIITGEEGACQFAVAVNGTASDRGDINALQEIAPHAAGADAVLLYECAIPAEKIRELCPDKTVFDMAREVEAVLKGLGLPCNEATVSNFFAVHPYAGNGKLDAALRIFLELQYRKSPKVRDFNNSILGLVALGSIADIVPLTGENRILVHFGLESLKSTDHEGLSLLIDNRRVNSRTIGWHVAPVLNAPGRMGKTDFTADFLINNNGSEARNILEEITRLNERRKSIVAEHFGIFMKNLEDGLVDMASPLVFAEIDAPEGVAGLIANRIADEVNRPVVVVSRQGDGVHLKGSGRVKGSFDFFARIEPLAGLFEKLGGHAHAFGFTVNADRLGEVRNKMEEALASCTMEENTVEIDGELSIEEITTGFITALSKLEPYGNRNEEPVFCTRNAAVKGFSRLGSGKNHGKYLFRGNPQLEALGWGMADDMELCVESGYADLVYRLEISTYNSRNSPRMILVDVSAPIPRGR
jgi:single-stranded-DNA-specific exonuclease